MKINKKIIFTSLWIIFALLHCFILTSDIGRTIAFKIQTILKNTKQEMIKPDSITDDILSFKEYETLEMGVRYKIPITYNSSYNFKLIYETKDDDYKFNSNNSEFYITPFYKDQEYETSITIKEERFPEYQKTFKYKVIKPVFNNDAKIYTSFIHGFINENDKYILQENVPLAFYFYASQAKPQKTVYSYGFKYEYDPTYFDLDLNINSFIPKKVVTNQTINIYFDNKLVKSINVDIVNKYKNLYPDDVKFVRFYNPNKEKLFEKNELSIYEYYVPIFYKNEKEILIDYKVKSENSFVIAPTSYKYFVNIIGYDYEIEFVFDANHSLKTLIPVKLNSTNNDVNLNDPFKDVSFLIKEDDNKNLSNWKNTIEFKYPNNNYSFKVLNDKNDYQIRLHKYNKGSIEFEFQPLHLKDYTFKVCTEFDGNIYEKEFTFPVKFRLYKLTNANGFVGKVLGHLFGFFISGTLFASMLKSYDLKNKKIIIFSVLSGIILPSIVELIQLLDPSRFDGLSELFDILFGFIGFMIGLGLILLIYFIKNKKEKKNLIE